MKERDVSALSIGRDCNLLEALKKMDSVNRRLLIVVGENSSTLLSIGDIQRCLLKKQDLTESVASALRDDIIMASVDDDLIDVKNLMLKLRIEFMPVLDKENKIDAIIFWEDLFDNQPKLHKGNLGCPVVIMAGGKGTRLRPITHIIPKPLIPVGEKAIIEIIVEHFKGAGCYEFFFSVSYKANMIKAYFDDIPDKDIDITYYSEDIPLGTAGSLSLIKDKLKTTFFVSNCDVIIEQDYSEIYDYHKRNGNELTAVAFVKDMEIPYGTFEVGEGGILKSLVEKPKLNFLVNAGMYILEPHLLDDIPENKFFHITHLMENIIARNGKVGVFPISEGSWLDIGQWKEYNRTLKKFGSEIVL